MRSKLLYCSVVWRPYLLVDIKFLELVQRRATKFIIKGSDLDYRQRLETLHLLPLMMEFEMADILFFVKSLKYPSEYFNIQNFVQFCDQSTRSSTYFTLKHPISRNSAESNLFFNRIPRLWNSLPSLDLSLPLSSIKLKLCHIFLTHFISNFDANNVCSYRYVCPCYKCSKMPVSLINRLFLFLFCSFVCLFCMAAGFSLQSTNTDVITHQSHHAFHFLCCKAIYNNNNNNNNNLFSYA